MSSRNDRTVMIVAKQLKKELFPGKCTWKMTRTQCQIPDYY